MLAQAKTKPEVINQQELSPKEAESLRNAFRCLIASNWFVAFELRRSREYKPR